jgi:hypothetical protein
MSIKSSDTVLHDEYDEWFTTKTAAKPSDELRVCEKWGVMVVAKGFEGCVTKGFVEGVQT